MELATQTLDDYSISPRERKASESRLAMGNWQRNTLLQSASTQNNDFYLYRYLATEGFLPGYNFPRLPLMAYVQGSANGKNQRYIQRARFLAISEFGPQSLVYHEGRAFRVDRALLKDAGLKDAGDRPELAGDLYVRVATHQGTTGLYAYFARVSLQQLVTIEGNQERAFVDTWDLDSLGTVGEANLPQVQRVVLQIVDVFIDDYFSVNDPR